MPAEYAKTIDELAAKIGVSRRTVIDWTKIPGFPQPGKRGRNVSKVQEWCAANNRGPNRVPSARVADGGDSEEISLHEATRRKTIAQAESERIKADTAAIEQAKLLKEILLADDVRSMCAQMVATAIACVSGFETAIDREIPDDAAHKQRAMALARKLHSDMSSAMQSLW